MSQVRVLEHPALQHFLTKLRDKNTPPFEFRRTLGQISHLMAYEASVGLKTKLATVETPLETGEFPVVAEDLLLVSIMRAGNGMLEPMMDMFPFAKASSGLASW